jgi:RNA-directed DNA polymerase
MMNDREESDPAIVAVSLANNAGSPAAEQEEPRAGTKGNAEQQNTRRAQDRESVSHALDRIRQAARQRRQEKFTSLFHHLSPETLRTAFYALKRDAASGVLLQERRTQR